MYGPPYGNQSRDGNVWSYLNDDKDWVNAPVGEIMVECIYFEEVQSKYNRYILLPSSKCSFFTESVNAICHCLKQMNCLFS